MRNPVFCIGASAGGVAAIQTLLSGLGPQFLNPIVITQHMGERNFDLDLQLIFGRFYSGSIIDIIDKTPIENHGLYFAPAGYHLLIEKDFSFSLSQEEAVNYSRPSIDVFFESAAMSLQEKCCGVLLTGANNDGAKGLKYIQKMGGRTIVQNPKTAENSVMPQSALDLMKPDQVLSLSEISQYMMKFSQTEMTL